MTEGGPSVEEFTNLAEFRAALRRFLRRSERAARQSGLTPQRHLLLLMIKGAPDGSQQSTVTELAERLQLAQSTVTELVRRAEEVGFIERQQSTADGRVAHLRLTPEGEQRLHACFTDLDVERSQLREAFAYFDAPQRRVDGSSGGVPGVAAELGDP
jgi:DNA-binding MarR family transcriptional regulator